MGQSCSSSSGGSSQPASLPQENQEELIHNIHYKKAFVDVLYGKNNRDQVLQFVNQGNVDGVITHIEAGFPVNYALNDEGWTLLHAAAFTGKSNLIELLIDKGADVNVKDSEEKWTPLMASAIGGQPDATKLLLKAEADPSLQDKIGWSALELAEKYKNKEVQEILLSAAEM